MFQSNPIIGTAPLNNIDEEKLRLEIEPTLRLLQSIFEKYLKNEWANRRYTHIPQVLFKEHNLLDIMESFTIGNNEALCYDSAYVAHLIHLITMCTDSTEYMITADEALPHLKRLFDLIERAIDKKHAFNTIKLINFTITKWYWIHKRIQPITHKNINKDPLVFQLQLVVLQLVPTFYFSEQEFNMHWDFESIDHVHGLYVDKFVKELCQDTIRLGYKYRRMLNDINAQTKEIAVFSVKYIQLSIRYYDRKAAVFVFQALIYVFNNCNTSLKYSDRALVKKAVNDSNFYSIMMVLLTTLIEKFDLTWKDCTESTCVVNVVVNFLMITRWSLNVSIFLLIRIFNFIF